MIFESRRGSTAPNTSISCRNGSGLWKGGEIKSLSARTLGMRPTRETEDDYDFGGTPSPSQTMLPPATA